MPVSDQHKDYTANITKWQTVRDCVEGSSAIKAGKTKYLPKPNSTEISAENDKRYSDYLIRANFVGFTGSTLDGLQGMVFRKDTAFDLQPQIAYLEENMNGGGLSLDQGIRRVTSEVLQTARHGILVDYPTAPEGRTKADDIAGNYRANILLYAAESIINWRTKVFGAVRKLSLVVLEENNEQPSLDGFSVSCEKQYRVLRLSAEGVYTQQILDEKGDEVGPEITPKKFDNTSWNEIPFIFCGAENNDEEVDKAPLYDIAEINISHYRNSADYEESCFMVGQPTPVLSGLSKDWVTNVLKGGVQFGSRTAITLPEGGNASLLQANPNQMPERGMELKENQMVKIGARIIQDTSANEVVDSVRMRYAGQTSKLATVVGNVQSAFKNAIEWASMFMGAVEYGSEIDINRKFYDESADPQLIMAEIQLFDRAITSKKDLRDSLRNSGLIASDRTDEIIDDEIEQDPPITTPSTTFE